MGYLYKREVGLDRGEMVKTTLTGHTRERSRTSAPGRDVPGSLLGLMSLQGIIENIQVRKCLYYNLQEHLTRSSVLYF